MARYLDKHNYRLMFNDKDGNEYEFLIGSHWPINPKDIIKLELGSDRFLGPTELYIVTGNFEGTSDYRAIRTATIVADKVGAWVNESQGGN